MTYDEVMALSGRALDAAVAEHVLGMTVSWRSDRVATGPFYRHKNRQWLVVPLYSRNAWPVHQRMLADDTRYDYTWAILNLLGDRDSPRAFSDEFICRAALMGMLRLFPAESDSNQCESGDEQCE